MYIELTRPEDAGFWAMEIVRKMGPLSADHPLVLRAVECPGCDAPFKVGEWVTLVTIGPGDSPESRERARKGAPYTAVSLAAHYA